MFFVSLFPLFIKSEKSESKKKKRNKKTFSDHDQSFLSVSCCFSWCCLFSLFKCVSLLFCFGTENNFPMLWLRSICRGIQAIWCRQRWFHNARRDVQYCGCHLSDGGKFMRRESKGWQSLERTQPDGYSAKFLNLFSWNRRLCFLQIVASANICDSSRASKKME